MSDDIVERLRALARDYHQHRPHYTEAADEIERLREALRMEIERLRNVALENRYIDHVAERAGVEKTS